MTESSVELVTIDKNDENKIICFSVPFEWIKDKVLSMGNNFDFIEFFDNEGNLECSIGDGYYYSETQPFYDLAKSENVILNIEYHDILN